MPTEDVSDLRDVVDAINKLCENMKNSYDETKYEDCSEGVDVNPFETKSLPNMTESLESRSIQTDSYDSVSNSMNDLDMRWYNLTASDSELKDPLENLDSMWSNQEENLETVQSNLETDFKSEFVNARENMDSEIIEPIKVEDSGLVNPIEVVVKKIETHVAERWSDPIAEDTETIVSDTENMITQFEPISEMYYTASSEVSLLSETDIIEKLQGEDSDKEKDDRQSVMAGHVAAMRERFESMTRANTPCPDLIRSLSPSLDCRNITPSPDFLDRS